MSVQSARIEMDALARFEATLVPRLAPQSDAVQRVVQSLRVAQRPVLWVGHGVRLAGATRELASLVDQLDIPVLLSWAGIDMLNSHHPRVYGRAGVYGQRSANFVLQNSDYVLTIGNRMAIPQVGYDLSELARGAQIDVVDIDETEGTKLGDRVRTFIHSDAAAFIDALQGSIADGIGAKTEWLKQCDQYREQFPWIGPEHADSEGFINSYRFMERLNMVFKPGQKVVTDMGTALLCGHQVLKFQGEQRMMTSTGLGEMGYGLPAAIGVSFATDRGEVMCLNCDGGMMMNLQELQTIVHYQLPIKIVVFNNDGYLMIKHTQKAVLKGRYAGTDKRSGVSCPDFSKVASAFEMPAYQIRTWKDFDRLMPKVLDAHGPVICEVFMDPEQFFHPKLGVSIQPDGSLISPPLEDLSPFITRELLEASLAVPILEKSKKISRTNAEGSPRK
jgi:acetolactate synthase-1/2/3 large subunit